MLWVTHLINNGVVSGDSVPDANGDTFVALWSAGQSAPQLLNGYELPLLGNETLDTPVGSSTGLAGGINDNGVIVGMHPLWSPVQTDRMRLPPLPRV